MKRIETIAIPAEKKRINCVAGLCGICKSGLYSTIESDVRSSAYGKLRRCSRRSHSDVIAIHHISIVRDIRQRQLSIIATISDGLRLRKCWSQTYDGGFIATCNLRKVCVIEAIPISVINTPKSIDLIPSLRGIALRRVGIIRGSFGQTVEGNIGGNYSKIRCG